MMRQIKLVRRILFGVGVSDCAGLVDYWCLEIGVAIDKVRVSGSSTNGRGWSALIVETLEW